MSWSLATRVSDHICTGIVTLLVQQCYYYLDKGPSQDRTKFKFEFIQLMLKFRDPSFIASDTS
uniref:Uncharacterized protein n=1 Tax=Moniliophthora roreri TaxID=221103 RepID=A0A0W0FIX0_MONRR